MLYMCYTAKPTDFYLDRIPNEHRTSLERYIMVRNLYVCAKATVCKWIAQSVVSYERM